MNFRNMWRYWKLYKLLLIMPMYFYMRMLIASRIFSVLFIHVLLRSLYILHLLLFRALRRILKVLIFLIYNLLVINWLFIFLIFIILYRICIYLLWTLLYSFHFFTHFLFYSFFLVINLSQMYLTLSHLLIIDTRKWALGPFHLPLRLWYTPIILLLKWLWTIIIWKVLMRARSIIIDLWLSITWHLWNQA